MIDIKQCFKLCRVYFEHLVLCKVFKEHYRKKEEYAAFIKRFPCRDCRPDGCTFYWDIPCKCQTCGRKYHI